MSTYTTWTTSPDAADSTADDLDHAPQASGELAVVMHSLDQEQPTYPDDAPDCWQCPVWMVARVVTTEDDWWLEALPGAVGLDLTEAQNLAGRLGGRVLS